MKHRSEQLYNEMQNDIRHCLDKGLSFQVETECCFRISEEYWNLLRADLQQFRFSNLADEIYFFKEIKPRFIAESEYYRLVNYAANFCPDDEFPEDQKNFWTRQLNRLDKFKLQNEEFWIYFTSDQKSKDELYFTREKNNSSDYVFDKAISGFDELIGQLIARQRYSSFAGERLRVCIQNL